MENFARRIWIRPDSGGSRLFRMEMSGDFPEDGMVFYTVADDRGSAKKRLLWYLARKYPVGLSARTWPRGTRCKVTVTSHPVPTFSWSVSYETMATDSVRDSLPDTGTICSGVSGTLAEMAYEIVIRGFNPEIDSMQRRWQTDCVVDKLTGRYTIYELRVDRMFDLGLFPVVNSIVTGTPQKLPDDLEEIGFRSWSSLVGEMLPDRNRALLGEGDLWDQWFRRFHALGYLPEVAAGEFVEKTSAMGIRKWTGCRQ